MAPPEPGDAARARAEAVLRERWGYPSFRPGQWAAIAPLLEGRDVLAVLPTGGGKSILYQLPALLAEGVTLVVSPLIALMQDQVEALKAHGVSATFINSTLSPREVDQRWTDTEHGRYRLVYLAPERLLTDRFAARADRLKVALLAVDEAHCVSEWGHHFRPAYLRIAEARALVGDPPTIAVTATATPAVRRDVVEHLALRAPHVLVHGFDRPNVVWSVFETDAKQAVVRDVLSGVPGAGLVYATTRRGAERWAAWLRREGVEAAAYHGGMGKDARSKTQSAWIDGRLRVVAATNAFGMGIDKPDVRFVIHAEPSGTLEAYYQEAGRAGRDGDRSFAVLLFHPSDEATQGSLIESAHPAAADVRRVYDAVCSLAQIAVGSLPEAPLSVDAEAVGRVAGLSAGAVRGAVELLARSGAWQVLPPRRHHGLIRFTQPAERVRAYADGLANRTLAAFVSALLRTVHADAFTAPWEIDLRLLERRTGLAGHRLTAGLGFLHERGLVDWRPPGAALRVELLSPRTTHPPVDDLAVRRARRRAAAQYADMLRYARGVTCRRHFLLAYFGEKSPARCGQCDVCLGRHRGGAVTPADEPHARRILAAVVAGRPRAEWFGDDEAPPNVDRLVAWLVQEAYVTRGPDGALAPTESAHAYLDAWAPRS